MNYDRAHTVCFSGHRSFKTGSGEWQRIALPLSDRIAGLYREGYDTFLTGMAEGFDMLAAREVLRLRDSGDFTDIKLIAVLPYAGHGEEFNERLAAQHTDILQCADHTEILCSGYDPRCYHQRDDFLVDSASCLVAYYNGSPGGTRYTYRRAIRRGLKVVNIFNGEAVYAKNSLF